MVKSSTDQCLETRKIWEFADGETRTSWPEGRMQERTDRCEHPCRGQRRLQCTDAPAKSGNRKFADFFLQGGLPIRESRLTIWD